MSVAKALRKTYMQPTFGGTTKFTFEVPTWDVPFFNAMSLTKDPARRFEYFKAWIEYTRRWRDGEDESKVFHEMEDWFNRKVSE